MTRFRGHLLPRQSLVEVRPRSSTQAGGPWADAVRGAIEACRLAARQPAGVRLGGGGDAV